MTYPERLIQKEQQLPLPRQRLLEDFTMPCEKGGGGGGLHCSALVVTATRTHVPMACTLLRIFQLSLQWCHARNEGELNEKPVPDAQVCLVQPVPSIGDSALFLTEDRPSGGVSVAHGSKGLHLVLNHSRSLEEVSPVPCRRPPSPFQRQSSFCVESDERLDQDPVSRSPLHQLDSPSPPISETLPFLTQVAAEIHPTPSESDNETLDPVPGPSGINSRTLKEKEYFEDEDRSHDFPAAVTKSRGWELDNSSPFKGFFQLPRPTSPLAIVPEDEVWEEDNDEDDDSAEREKQSGNLQRTASIESGALENMMEERRRLLKRQDGTQLSDGDDDDENSEPRAKVRYNDTGSLEEVDEDALDQFATEQLLTESIMEDKYESAHLREQYKKLWKLRATLEETVEDDDDDEDNGEDEEEDVTGCVQIQSSSSEPIMQAEDVTSPEHSPEQIENHFSNANKNTKTDEVEAEEKENLIPADQDDHAIKTEEISELQEKRESYKSILTQRLQKRRPSGGPTPHSSADDSFDSLETEEGSSTDASRVEVATSFESTDNTDSPGEGQASRLQQMKADSGYKSLETNGKPPKLSKKQIHFVLDDETIDVMETSEKDEGVSVEFEASMSIDDETGEKPEETTTVPSEERKETETKMEGTSKTSVFTRLFRTNSRERHPRIFSRDYSIDEKSDLLFREFSRIDPAYEVDGTKRSRSPRLHSRHRLHPRHSIDGSDITTPRSRRKLAQQDNIEDEIRLERSPDLPLAQEGIPVIQVAEEETV